MFLWVSKTPLGTPVEPDVYIIIAVSSAFGETVAALDVFPTLIISENGISRTPSW